MLCKNSYFDNDMTCLISIELIDFIGAGKLLFRPRHGDALAANLETEVYARNLSNGYGAHYLTSVSSRGKCYLRSRPVQPGRCFPEMASCSG